MRPETTKNKNTLAAWNQNVRVNSQNGTEEKDAQTDTKQN